MLAKSDRLADVLNVVLNTGISAHAAEAATHSLPVRTIAAETCTSPASLQAEVEAYAEHAQNPAGLPEAQRYLLARIASIANGDEPGGVTAADELHRQLWHLLTEAEDILNGEDRY